MSLSLDTGGGRGFTLIPKDIDGGANLPST